MEHTAKISPLALDIIDRACLSAAAQRPGGSSGGTGGEPAPESVDIIESQRTEREERYEY